jgi:hypothetical protein
MKCGNKRAVCVVALVAAVYGGASVRAQDVSSSSDPLTSGRDLNYSRLPDPVIPIGELIFRDGQVYRSRAEADAAEKELRERQELLRRAMEQPHPVAAKQAEAAEKRLKNFGIVGAVLIAACLLRALVFRKSNG